MHFRLIVPDLGPYPVKDQSRFRDREKSAQSRSGNDTRCNLERCHLPRPVHRTGRPVIVIYGAWDIIARRIGNEDIRTPGCGSGIDEIHRPHVIKNLRENLIAFSNIGAIESVFFEKAAAKPRDRLRGQRLKILVHRLVRRRVVYGVTLGILTRQKVTLVFVLVAGGVFVNRRGEGEEIVEGRAKIVVFVNRPDGDPRTAIQVEFRRATVGREEEAHLLQGTRGHLRIGH